MNDLDLVPILIESPSYQVKWRRYVIDFHEDRFLAECFRI